MQRTDTMLSLALSALMALIAIAVVATLVDCWISGIFMLAKLREERALLDAGFVPMVSSGQHRLRKPVDFSTLATPARLPGHLPAQLPARPSSQPLSPRLRSGRC
jgi:hypothetical protein